MPPTTAARWMMRSGFPWLSARSIPSRVRRSYSELRGTKISAAPAWRSRLTTALPRNPLPPVTITRREVHTLVMKRPPLRQVLNGKSSSRWDDGASSHYRRWLIRAELPHQSRPDEHIRYVSVVTWLRCEVARDIEDHLGCGPWDRDIGD